MNYFQNNEPKVVRSLYTYTQRGRNLGALGASAPPQDFTINKEVPFLYPGIAPLAFCLSVLKIVVQDTKEVRTTRQGMHEHRTAGLYQCYFSIFHTYLFTSR